MLGVLELFAQSKESPAVASLREMQGALTSSAGSLVQKFQATGAETQLAFAAAAVVLALIIMVVMLFVLRRPGHASGAVDELLERLDRLEVVQREQSQTGGLHPEIRGAIGYFKQELRELRQICMATHQNVSSHPAQRNGEDLYAAASRDSGSGRGSGSGGDSRGLQVERTSHSAARSRAGEIPTRFVAETRAAFADEPAHGGVYRGK